MSAPVSPNRSQLIWRAAAIAVLIGPVTAGLIFVLMVSTRWKGAGSLMGGGTAIWNALFEAPYHGLTWLFALLAINAVIYSGLVFAVEIVIIEWRQRRQGKPRAVD
jgi:hypothetical protein